MRIGINSKYHLSQLLHNFKSPFVSYQAITKWWNLLRCHSATIYLERMTQQTFFGRTMYYHSGMNVLLMDENGYFKILHSCGLDKNDCNSHGFPDGPVSTANVFKMGRPARISNTPHFLLVDTWAQAVRVIDIDAELMHTLCYDGNRTFFEFPEGAKTQLCHVILPTSILYIDTESVLYVGMENALWRAALHHGGMQVYTLPYRAKNLIGIIFRKICNSENREIRNPLFTQSIMH